MRDGKSAGIKAGDEVEVYRPDGRVVYLKAKSVSYAGKTAPEECKFLNTQPMAKHIAKPPRMSHCVWIEFEDGSAPEGGYVVGMGRACPNPAAFGVYAKVFRASKKGRIVPARKREFFKP